MALNTLLAFRGIYFMYMHGIMMFRSCHYITDPRLTFGDCRLLKSINVYENERKYTCMHVYKSGLILVDVCASFAVTDF